MSDVLIRAALEKRLDLISPALDTAYENVPFEPSALPYQRINILRAHPENPEMGAMRRLSGIFQVTLFYPLDDGPGGAEARAEAIRDQFPRALSLSEGGVVVTVDGTPEIMAGFRDNDRWTVPVRVPYFSNIS